MADLQSSDLNYCRFNIATIQLCDVDTILAGIACAYIGLYTHHRNLTTIRAITVPASGINR